MPPEGSCRDLAELPTPPQGSFRNLAAVQESPERLAGVWKSVKTHPSVRQNGGGASNAAPRIRPQAFGA